MTDNPFEASGAAAPPGEVALFTDRQVAVVTAFATLFAGAALLGVNATRLDRLVAPVVRWTAGVLLLMAVGSLAGPVGPWVGVLGMWAVSRLLHDAQDRSSHPSASWAVPGALSVVGAAAQGLILWAWIYWGLVG